MKTQRWLTLYFTLVTMFIVLICARYVSIFHTVCCGLCTRAINVMWAARSNPITILTMWSWIIPSWLPRNKCNIVLSNTEVPSTISQFQWCRNSTNAHKTVILYMSAVSSGMLNPTHSFTLHVYSSTCGEIYVQCKTEMISFKLKKSKVKVPKPHNI